MAVITQNYDIDLKATGEYPVVKMSQFDTGSRTIVFTVYDGHELAAIDGMVARVDGTRSDGVEFSSTCTVSAGSKVSFTINQEMTKHAGKHTAELVIFDANGNPAGTQNFVIEVEPATMVRDSAASADDRTLYDQFTDSVSKTVANKMAAVDNKMNRTWNAVSLGVDNTGTKNVGATINTILAYDGCPGLYFPAGTYNIESPIDCKAKQSIDAAAGARFVAVSAIDHIIAVDDGQWPDKRGVITTIQGGVWDGNDLATDGIVLNGSGNQIIVNNLSILQCKGTHLKCNAHAPFVDHVLINSHGQSDSVGVEASYDAQFNSVKIFECVTGIKNHGFNQYSDVYIYSGGGSFQADNVTHGFVCTENANIMMHNVYLDCCQYGIYSPDNAIDIFGDGLYYYANPGDTPVDSVPKMYALRLTWDSQFNVTNFACKPTRPVYFSYGNFTADVDIKPNNVSSTYVVDYWRILSAANTHNSIVGIYATDQMDLQAGYSYEIFRIKKNIGRRFEFIVQNLYGERLYAGTTEGSYSTSSRKEGGYDTDFSLGIDKTADAEGYVRVFWNAVKTNTSTRLIVRFIGAAQDLAPWGIFVKTQKAEGIRTSTLDLERFI